MAKSVVIEIDHGWLRIKSELLKQAGRQVCRAGLFGEDTYDNGMPVSQVGAFNEYGTSRAPSRPFMRPAVDKDHEGMKRQTEELLSALYQGSLNIKDLNLKIGENLIERVRNEINEFTDPPNAPSTIRMKGSSHPLIDTGFMLKSLKVKDGKGDD